MTVGRNGTSGLGRLAARARDALFRVTLAGLDLGLLVTVWLADRLDRGRDG